MTCKVDYNSFTTSDTYEVLKFRPINFCDQFYTCNELGCSFDQSCTELCILMSLTLYHSGYGYSKRLCEDVINWFIEKYLPRHKLEIEVLHRGLKREGALGYCDVAGETVRPRSFLIELDTHMNKKTYATVLIHELIHLRQWVKGELKLKASKMHYKGECIEYLNYFEKPHEIFALYYEGILYQSYLKDRGLTAL